MPQTCSMVSNSPTLLLSKAGHVIDSVDGPVARFNDAVVDGYEAYVGNRTDIMIVNDVILHQWAASQSGPRPGIKHVIINDFGRGIKDTIMQYLHVEHNDINF